MHLKALPAAGALAVALLATGATSGMAMPSTAATQSTPAATKASTVKVVMKEWSFRTSVTSVRAGKVTFVVRNAGTMEHEFVVLRTDRAPRALLMKGNRASEAGMKGEIEEFRPSLTKRLTLTLKPGKYVLLCNLPGHYKRGQAIGLVVTPAVVAAETTHVDVSMFEMGFELSKTTVSRGTIVFEVRNDGKAEHDFSFGSRGGTRLLEPGERATLTVAFPRPGTFTFVCTVEGHAAAGMIGKLVVT
jgi:uncharacterized cupredoxin-like copper-binding protein